MNFILGIPVLPIDGIPPFTPYKGSIQKACEDCGRVVWQGPAQQLYKADNPEAKIVCAICAITKYGMGPDNSVMLTNKGRGD